MKVGLFIVGAPKAGTTSLYHYLNEHPEVFMSEKKEIDFFSHEYLNKIQSYYNTESVSDLESYNLQFSGLDNQKIIGEGSVSYLYYPQVPLKIKEYNSNSKIIIMLRNPVDRAYSHYLMDFRLGLIDVPFKDFVDIEEIDHSCVFYQQFIGLGFYYNQVKRYLDTFGSSNVHIIEYESFKSNTAKEVFRVFDFLKINSSFSPRINRVHNRFSMPKNKFLRKLYSQSYIRTFASSVLSKELSRKIKKLFFKKEKPVLSSVLRKKMVEVYSEDVLRLEKLIKIDLSSWLK